MKKNFLFITVCILSAFLFLLQLNCSPKKTMTNDELIARGEYLVNFGGCNDCHSPKIMTPMGPAVDTAKLLSGYPASQPVLPIDAGLITPGKWVLTNDESLIWAGPWGISFSANITSDSSTGIGGWTLENFVIAMRTGKHLGNGRMILPPMPWDGVGKLTDDDLKAMFTYLQTVPAINNRVPNPVPPNMITGSSGK
jgi:mono/diheme cytochrome c family protein